MKRIIIIGVILTIAFCSTACRKKVVKPFLGQYTYQTSGNIVVGTDTSEVNINLLNEIGRMELIDIDEDDRVMVVKKSLTGKVEKTYATISDDDITFDDVMSIETFGFDTLQFGGSLITKSAHGTRYNDNIIIDETYSGIVAAAVLMGTIKESNITTVAKKDEE